MAQKGDDKDRDALPARRGATGSSLELAEKNRARLLVPIRRGEEPLTKQADVSELVARKRLRAPIRALVSLAGVLFLWSGVAAINSGMLFPTLSFLAIGLSFLVGGLVTSRKTYREYRQLVETLETGVMLPATVIGHGIEGPLMRHQAYQLRPVVTVEIEYDGEKIEQDFETANPEVTHPIGTVIQVLYHPETGDIFIPDEEGLRLEPPLALEDEESEANEDSHDEAPSEPEAPDVDIFSSKPSLTAAYPPAQYLNGPWEGLAGFQRVVIDHANMTVVDASGDVVASFELEKGPAVNMGRTEDEDVLISIRQQRSGWERWQFLLAGSDWEAITGEEVHQLMPQAYPEGTGSMDPEDGRALLAHIRAFEDG